MFRKPLKNRGDAMPQSVWSRVGLTWHMVDADGCGTLQDIVSSEVKQRREIEVDCPDTTVPQILRNLAGLLERGYLEWEENA